MIRAKEVKIPIENTYQTNSYVMCIAQCERRDELKKFLEINGIETLVYYGTPLHLHKASNIFGYKNGDFPNAERLCKLVLALPHHQFLTYDDISFVSKKINEFYGA